MKFSEEQLEQYRTLGYVIFDCPFPESLTGECMAAVEKAGGSVEVTVPPKVPVDKEDKQAKSEGNVP